MERHRKGEEIEEFRACEDLSEDWMSLKSRGLYLLLLLVRSIYWVQAQSLAPCKVRAAKLGQAAYAPSDTCLGATFSFLCVLSEGHGSTCGFGCVNPHVPGSMPPSPGQSLFRCVCLRTDFNTEKQVHFWPPLRLV